MLTSAWYVNGLLFSLVESMLTSTWYVNGLLFSLVKSTLTSTWYVNGSLFSLVESKLTSATKYVCVNTRLQSTDTEKCISEWPMAMPNGLLKTITRHPDYHTICMCAEAEHCLQTTDVENSKSVNGPHCQWLAQIHSTHCHRNVCENTFFNPLMLKSAPLNGLMSMACSKPWLPHNLHVWGTLPTSHWRWPVHPSLHGHVILLL